jgi:hypothetical protein
MELLVTRKHVTIKSGTQTDGTESIANRLKEDELWCHWPTRTAGLK